MSATHRKRGESRALYLDMIRKAGAGGITVQELVAANGVCRYSAVMHVLQPDLQAGVIKRQRPGTGRPARLFMPEHFPAEKVYKKRVYKSIKAAEKCIAKQGEWLDHLRSLKDQGALMSELEDHFGVSNQTASQYVQGLAKRGLILGHALGTGKSHRVKRWYALEHAPQFKAPERKPAAHQASRLDPSAPAIIPVGLQVIRAQPFVDTRFKFDPPPGWRGCIDSSQSREWAKHAQR